MKQLQTQQYNDDVILHIIVIISIFITELISCFTPSPKKSLQVSATNPSTKKKVSSSTRQSATSRMHPKEPSLALVTSTETSRESCVVTGCLSMETKNLKDGMTSQPTKKSRSGASTQSRSRQVTTKSNRITQTPGLGFSA